MPREVCARNRDQSDPEHRRALRIPERHDDVQQENRRYVDGGPLVTQDRLAAAIHEPVRRHEVRHVDERRQPRLGPSANKHEIRAPAQQERYKYDQR